MIVNASSVVDFKTALSGFDCGSSNINGLIRQSAGTPLLRNNGVTELVKLDNDRKIIGYVSGYAELVDDDALLRAVGYPDSESKSPFKAYISVIGVDRNHKGRSIGRMLLSTIFSTLVAETQGHIHFIGTAGIAEKGSEAIHFHNGFRKIGGVWFLPARQRNASTAPATPNGSATARPKQRVLAFT